MQLRFGHCALQIEKQAVVAIARIIDALLIDHHDASDRAQRKQTLPVR